MAKDMREVFGDMLLLEPIENKTYKYHMPSPNQLKYKIIIKVCTQPTSNV